MNRALTVAAALAVLLPSLSMAQQNQPDRQGGRPGGGTDRPGAAGPGQHGAQGPSQHGGGGRPMPQGQQSRPMPSHTQGRGPGQQPPSHGGYGRPLPTYVRPLPPRGNQFWHRGQYYGRVHGPAFDYPRGWGYRQWLIGQRLPPLFLAPGYFYPAWAQLGLQAPPPDYSWVRYGPDLLLVNLNTGEVEDVAYGVFQ